jgi:rare lipoprotein A
MAHGSLIKLSSSIIVFAATVLASTLASAISLPMKISAQSGIASVYAYSGELTADGETASPRGLTAAHRSLPFGTLVRVTNDVNGRSVVVRINDRGPFVDGRIIDLTPAGAEAIGSDGLAHVSLDIVGKRGRGGAG